VSYFADCYNEKDDWRCYIIKGGPGTGKSSFMKKVAQKAEDTDLEYILCPCSSDPLSLDAVILPSKKTVVLDGTAPHETNPRYPAVCEEILNFGQFWDSEKITDKGKIINLTDQNKAHHKTAQKYLAAAGQIMLDSYKTALSCTEIDKTEKFADRLCQKYIPKDNGTPYEWVRFLEGITPNGIISYPETILESCENVVIISDKFGACSNIIMNHIREFALTNRYEIITLKNAFLPSLITEHILIPKLSLAFVRESDYTKFDTDIRRTHARRFTSNKLIHKSKERLKLNEKILKSLLNSSTDSLKKAKAVHDELEEKYKAIMDYQALNTFSEKWIAKLFT
jgi:hypothetical protein